MRIFLSMLLATGAVLGIGGGLARLHHGGRHHRQHMLTRVAETCVEAARNLDREASRRDGPPGAPLGPHPAGPHPLAGAPPVYVPYPVPVALPTPSGGAFAAGAAAAQPSAWAPPPSGASPDSRHPAGPSPASSE